MDNKQIEEMAKCMCSSYESEKGCKTCPTIWCYAQECATRAFCNGYRKIPEGSIVVDKEYLKKELQGLERQACKVTAEKILKDVFNHITKPEVWDKLRTLWLNLSGGKNSNLPIWNLLIEPVAKQFGVEIEG